MLTETGKKLACETRVETVNRSSRDDKMKAVGKSQPTVSPMHIHTRTSSNRYAVHRTLPDDSFIFVFFLSFYWYFFFLSMNFLLLLSPRVPSVVAFSFSYFVALSPVRLFS